MVGLPETQINTFQKIPSVSECYANKTILISGASGFIGKVLVEKLLRCCPLISRIYVMLRRKKNMSPEERWNEITKLVVSIS